MSARNSSLPVSLIGISLAYDALGRLVLTDATGHRFVGVAPVRAFPFSDPTHWISLCDSEGREIVALENPADLPQPVRQILEADLAGREFIPVIQKINFVTRGSDPTEWTVETDRGQTQFTLSGEDDIQRLGPQRLIIRDVMGIRYLIPDTRVLNAASRQFLKRFS